MFICLEKDEDIFKNVHILKMEYCSKINCSIFNGHQLESAIDKKLLNITMIEELRTILEDIKNIKHYLHL